MRSEVAAGVCVLALAMPLATTANNSDRFVGGDVMILRVNGQIDVDTDGSVRSHEVMSDVTDDIRAMIGNAIAKWSFEPPMHEGRPTRTKSAMELMLLAQRHGKGFAVIVDEAEFGSRDNPDSGYWVFKDVHPKIYHPNSTPVVAYLPVVFRMAPDGKVLDAFAPLCAIQARSKHLDNSKACQKLERNAVNAIKGWRARYVPGADAEEAPSAPVTGIIRMQFVSEGAASFEKYGKTWKAEWRTARRDPPWGPLDDSLVEFVPGVDGYVQNAPALKLRDKVVGRGL